MIFHSSYSNNVETPLVLHFHGSGGSGTSGGDYLRWNTVSEEDVAAGGAGIMIVQGSGVDGLWDAINILFSFSPLIYFETEQNC